jgi:predicted DNA-binding transcriptional regulator AlpA
LGSMTERATTAELDHGGEAPSAPPLLVNAREAARLCGTAESSWWALTSAGRTPVSVRLGRRRLWRTEELARWVAAGCPPRDKWDAMNDAARGGKKF